MRTKLRIIVKTDAESSIGRGCVLYRDHFEPRVAKLIAGVAQATEELLPDARVLRLTEGWRPQRDPAKRDAHTGLAAIDFTIEFDEGIRALNVQYRIVSERARAIVGDAEYDFLVHGEASGLHIHGEYDPHK